LKAFAEDHDNLLYNDKVTRANLINEICLILSELLDYNSIDSFDPLKDFTFLPDETAYNIFVYLKNVCISKSDTNIQSDNEINFAAEIEFLIKGYSNMVYLSKGYGKQPAFAEMSPSQKKISELREIDIPVDSLGSDEESK
jgi:hypothetical protein